MSETSTEEGLKPLLEGEAIGTEVDTPGRYGGGEPEDDLFADPAAPKVPNSFYFPFGKWDETQKRRRAYISWQSDNPIMVLALVMLLLVLSAIVICAIAAAFSPTSVGISEVIKILGQAVLTLVGVIGGAASNRK